MKAAVKGSPIEHFHSGSHQQCKLMGTKKCAYLRKDVATTGLVWNNDMAAVTSCEIKFSLIYKHAMRDETLMM